VPVPAEVEVSSAVDPAGRLCVLIKYADGWTTLPAVDARRLAGMLLEAADAVDQLEAADDGPG